MRWLIFGGIIFSLFVSACEQEIEDKNSLDSAEEKDTLSIEMDTIFIDTLEKSIVTPPCLWDDYLLNEGLVNLQTIDSSILVELKYSTDDNFMQLDIYGCLTNCYLQPDVAERLKICQAKLKSIDSNLSLLVYDGLRPRLVQQYMWDLLDMPLDEKVKFVSNPAKGSLHNFGAAVDITIYDLNAKQALDMGTPYDYIGILAWPTKEPSLLKDSLLTQAQVDHRILLRKVMKEGNFFNIQTEWWHFNACYRDKAMELYHIIEGDSSFLSTEDLNL